MSTFFKPRARSFRMNQIFEAVASRLDPMKMRSTRWGRTMGLET